MDKTIENDFFKWYESVTKKYINGYGALYDYLYTEEYEEENRLALRDCVADIKKDLQHPNYQLIKEFGRYSPLWSEISINLQECRNIYSYSYYMLRPFEPLVNALNSDKTERSKYIQHTIGQKIAQIFLDPVYFSDWTDIEIELEGNNISFEELYDNCVVHFMVDFGSLLLEEYNLSGYDFEAICEHLHIQLYGIVRAYNLKAMPFKISSGQKYFPIYDKRLLPGNSPSRIKHKKEDKVAIPKALDTDECVALLTKAISNDLCEYDGKSYNWTGTIGELAYFADLCSERFRLSKRENATNWKPFAEMFGVDANKLRSAKSEWRNKGVYPAKADVIKALFTE